MKYLLIIVLTIISFSLLANDWNDQWLKQDKAAHLLGSVALTCIGTELAKDINIKNPEIIGVAFSLGLGLTKEFLYDTNPSPYDLGVNIIGSVIGVYINKWLQNKQLKWYNKR